MNENIITNNHSENNSGALYSNLNGKIEDLSSKLYLYIFVHIIFLPKILIH
jgi:hypothetical protein